MSKRPLKWAYGVTTVPARFNDLLPKTLHSLCDAGFGEPRLFVDGITEDQALALRRTYGLEVSARYPALKTAANWVMSLHELYLREPLCDRYAIFQDDFVTYSDLLGYLDQCEYPERGYWNLYTFPENHKREGEEYGWYLSNQKGKGAVALVFDRKTVTTLLGSTHLIERPQSGRRGEKSIDGGIVTALRKAGWREYVHYPSLVQHTGLVSSMGNRRHPLAPAFFGEGFNATHLLR